MRPLFSLSLSLLLAAHAVAGAVSGGAVCTTALDCFLNGDCVKGLCVCDAAWDGAACTVLATEPAYQLWPPVTVEPPPAQDLASSWGASIVQDDAGLWHGFFDVVCANFTWMHIEGAVIVHATAAVPEGPYTFSDVALPQQSMTPHIVRDGDGAWLLLHERQPNVTGLPQCTGSYGTVTGWGQGVRGSVGMGGRVRSGNNGPPSVARSTSLYGPWVPHDFSVSVAPGDIVPNPNPSLLPPVTPGQPYTLAFTFMPANYTTWGTERVCVATAASWQGGATFTPLPPSSGMPSPTHPGEDPFLWRSHRGYHIVYHAMSADANMHFTGVGGYAVSVDGVEWVFAPDPIYTTLVDMVGAGPVQFVRRERPEVLLDASTGAITHIVTGCEAVVSTTGHSSVSVLAPVRRATPSPSPSSYTYTVTVVSKGALPVLSKGLPPGRGFSPCVYTFNPAFLPAHPPGLNASIAIVRVSGCPEAYGGQEDHLLYAYCDSDGVCGDVQPEVLPFESFAEDPRVFFNEADANYYMYYFAKGVGQKTVYLRRTPTPLNLTSWELVVGGLPWHRNGCVIQLPNGTNVVIYGETYGSAYPGGYLPALGVATTADWATYDVVNASWLDPEPSRNEVCLEASTPPVRLSTGDYMHWIAAGTTGWGPWGPGLTGAYVARWLILSGSDPTRIVQGDTGHAMAPTMDYEIGNNTQWPVQRNHTLFMTSMVPVEGEADLFRCWYGAADANVATALIRVTATPAS